MRLRWSAAGATGGQCRTDGAGKKKPGEITGLKVSVLLN
jgi:hypothetical protein